MNQKDPALAGVAQRIECQPANWKVAGLIPSQGTGLGCRPGPQLGVVWEATTHWCFSPFLSSSLPLSLKIKNLKKKNPVLYLPTDNTFRLTIETTKLNLALVKYMAELLLNHFSNSSEVHLPNLLWPDTYFQLCPHFYFWHWHSNSHLSFRDILPVFFLSKLFHKDTIF